MLNRNAGTEGESLTAPKSSIRAWSAPCSSSRRLGKRSSKTRFRRASAVSALCQMKRASPVLMSRGATAGIHAASLTRSERSQKKKRLSSWAVSKRIHRALGCGLDRNSDVCDMALFFLESRPSSQSANHGGHRGHGGGGTESSDSKCFRAALAYFTACFQSTRG